MNLLEAKNLAIELMQKHDLINNGWRFEFNNRKKSLGLCDQSIKTIYLSTIFTSQLPENIVRNTILHEIAHALVGCENGHNHIWKRKALEIGCTGDRCADLSSEGIKITMQSKYKATCKHCKKVYHSHRRRKRASSCTCSPKRGYDSDYKLEFVQQY